MSFRDTGYLPFYCQGYRILSILLPWIWDNVFNILVTFRDIDYLGKLTMGIFANFENRIMALVYVLLCTKKLHFVSRNWRKEN